MEPEWVKFTAREILILRQLSHPNVVKLESLVTIECLVVLYLVFEYMENDLAGLAASPTMTFIVPQVKCYMNQLLSGLEHCHNNDVLHRDIKGSNLLIFNEGVLKIADFANGSFIFFFSKKIADFGLATIFYPKNKHPMTSRVVRSTPELFLDPLTMVSWDR